MILVGSVKENEKYPWVWDFGGTRRYVHLSLIGFYSVSTFRCICVFFIYIFQIFYMLLSNKMYLYLFLFVLW